jgi:GTPase SAR1 family protein
MLGRRQERRHALRALSRADGAGVVVVGAPGAGKTTFAASVLERLPADADVELVDLAVLDSSRPARVDCVRKALITCRALDPAADIEGFTVVEISELSEVDAHRLLIQTYDTLGAR